MENNKQNMSGLRVPREVLTKDLVAGLVMSIVNVPGALANGLLAGINPVFGVYSMIAGTTVAALFTSSVIMNVDSTSATSIATGDFLAGITSEEQQGYLVVLGILVGLWMLTFGLLKLGFLVRFISNSVMTGFLSGLGVLTILGQVGDITGYYSFEWRTASKLPGWIPGEMLPILDCVRPASGPATTVW
jgi:SulP family sulfate permease